ncbi:MAG: glycosyltransferase family 4 protein [Candidatus Aminicenantes bacterium]|nr:glycosyltransferase family 4 protein [Candidatus Aminicenantes bacterium]
MRVDQLVPAFHRGDAIGDTAFHMRQFLRSRGFQSDIYCLSCDEELSSVAKSFSTFPKPHAADTVILHFALPSPLTQAFIQSSGRKVILYHNITPAEFFRPFSREMERISRVGREELQSLVPHVTLSLADSEFNRQELVGLGFKRAEVFPLFIDFEKYKKPVNRFMYTLFDDDRVNILFVGRIVPNKRIDALIKVLFYYKKYVSSLVRLIVVGKTSSLPKYHESLIRLADSFYLNPEEIVFTGHIPDDELFALYKASDVFLSLSQHEGFGLPFVESMIFDLPVVAYNCSAVPYTLGSAGVLVNDNMRVDQIGELVHTVAHDAELRSKIIRGQRRQLKTYKEKKQERSLIDFLENIKVSNEK